MLRRDGCGYGMCQFSQEIVSIATSFFGFGRETKSGKERLHGGPWGTRTAYENTAFGSALAKTGRGDGKS